MVYFKVVPKGARVGYDGKWVASDDTRVITLPVGYGDGYRRALSNKGSVLVGGKRYPIVGSVSMDQMMVNIEQDTAHNGDEAVLIGSQGAESISIEEIAELVETSPYEIMVGINTRVPRRYL